MKRILRNVPIAQPRLSLRAAVPPVAHKALGTVHAAGLAMPAPAPAQAPELSPEQVRARAEKAGYDDGYRRGMAQARADLDAELQKLGRLHESLASLVASQPGAAADMAAEFAFTVACRVLGEHAVSPAAVQGCVEQALSHVALSAPAALRVHPQDAQILARAGLQHKGLEIRPDPEVAVGGCMIDHAQGCLDARLETQLTELKRAVLNWRAGESA